MSSSWIGVKAGFFAGTVQGLFISAMTYLQIVFSRSQITQTLRSALPPNSPITAEQLYNLTVTIGPIVAAGLALILGSIIGGIFGWLYQRIPGRSSTSKGIVFALIVFLILTMLGLSSLSYGEAYFITGLVANLASSLLYGVILGELYSHFSPKMEIAKDQ